MLKDAGDAKAAHVNGALLQSRDKLWNVLAADTDEILKVKTWNQGVRSALPAVEAVRETDSSNGVYQMLRPCSATNELGKRIPQGWPILAFERLYVIRVVLYPG
jgi:hypothetical protein